jgi:hypothetical protein
MVPNNPCAGSRASAVATAMPSMPAIARATSLEKSDGLVPSTFGLRKGFVGQPWGQGAGDHSATHFNTGRRRLRAGSFRGRTPSTIAAESPRWHTISCGVSVPQRRGLSVCSASSRSFSERRTCGSATVFARRHSPFTIHYSPFALHPSLSATIGSMRVARRAGM